eukprot:CCRYP_004861-RA/>CCRYP_004861-RA protein AED:0.43 eAED:0.43 QI:0/0/0/1/0/0/2/0/114
MNITLNIFRLCTTNPRLSTYEAMEGMYSFHATPMAPIGTECMIHTSNPHADRLGAVTDTGVVRLSDTFKILHNSLPTSTISDTDRIVKATQQLKLAIEGKRDASEDELRAIQHL